MDQSITPTWPEVELPILRAIVRADLADTDRVEAARAAVTVSDRRLHSTLEALEQSGYLYSNSHDVFGRSMHFPGDRFYPTERARRAVGQWPTADGLAAGLAAAFEQAAAGETDSDRKLSYRSAAQAIVTGVATTAITKYMGL